MNDEPVVQAVRMQAKEMADGSLRVYMDIVEKDKQKFQQLFPTLGMAVAMVPLTDVQEIKTNKGQYGDYARQLRLSAFFRTPKVWTLMGTDEEFREWIMTQPSAVSRGMDWDEGQGRWVCVAAHVRRSDESGTGIKADYACIPLMWDEHEKQHREGESSLMPQEWWEKKRLEYVVAWCWERMKEELGVESMADASPEMIHAWAKERDVENLLP